MNSSPDLYACLGVARTASPEDIQLAFRQVARRFHPDTNPDPSAAEEFKLVAHAHDVLSDARQRADCDAGTAPETIIMTLATTSSCEHLRPVSEPQAVYYLVNISATAPAVFPAPPLNVCLVIDRSTSMQGPRLDQVKAAAAQLIEGLKPNDQFSVVAFSDRAEVILSAQQSRNKSAAVSRVSTIIQALDKVTLYHLQEKAWAAMEGGDVAMATRRLERVASKLLAGNEPELAGVVRGEIDRMGNTRHVSAEGRKRIKYGTRALIAAPRDTT